MRLTIDARMFSASGIGTYLRNLLPHIVNARPEWSFNLIGDPSDLQSEPWVALPHVAVVTCRAPIYSVAEQILVPAAIPRGSDLFWTPHFNIPLAYPGRLLVTIQDVCHLAMPHLFRPHQRWYARLLIQSVKRKAAAIVCASEFTRTELLRLGVNGATTVTIHHGLSAAWFASGPSAPPHPRPYLLYVGNVKPHKNLRTLLEAFKRLSGSIPHDLVLVGKRTGFITGDSSVLQAAEALGSRVHFTGHVDAERLRRFFAHADVFVMPSLYEGFGFPPLEAMASSCPTIVAFAASLPEVCEDAALYFDPRSPEELSTCISRVLSDEALRRDLQARGRLQAARYTWERCADATLRVIDGLLPS